MTVAANSLLNGGDEPASAPRKAASAADVAVMHLRKALRAGLLEGSEPSAICRVAANALHAQAVERKEALEPGRVSRLLKRYGVALPEEIVAEITDDEAGWALMSVEDRGSLLTLARDARVAGKVWMLGAKGQTLEERITEREARRKAREARKVECRRAKRAAMRSPLHVNISAFMRAAGLSRREAERCHRLWLADRLANGGTEPLNSDPTYDLTIYAGQFFTRQSHCETKPWEVLGLSRTTYYRRKANGTLPQDQSPQLSVAKSSDTAGGLSRPASPRQRPLIKKAQSSPPGLKKAGLRVASQDRLHVIKGTPGSYAALAAAATHLRGWTVERHFPGLIEQLHVFNQLQARGSEPQRGKRAA